MLRRGFVGERAQTYDFERWPASAYVSDLDVLRLRERSRGVRLGSKLTLPALLAGAPDRAPRRVALLERGRVVALDGRPHRTVAALTGALLEGRRDFVIKPVFGIHAAGLQRAHFDGAGRLSLEGHALDAEALQARLSTLPFHIVEEHVAQHEGLARLHPATTNPVRVVVLHDADGPFVAAATLRLGTASSVPGVAFARGGLSVAIDPDTGRLGGAARRDERGRLNWVDVHPDTDETIAGTSIPRWNELCRTLLAICEPLRWIPAAAWDVVVTPDGFVVLALSPDPSFAIEQLHGPLRLDPRVDTFFDAILAPAAAAALLR